MKEPKLMVLDRAVLRALTCSEYSRSVEGLAQQLQRMGSAVASSLGRLVSHGYVKSGVTLPRDIGHPN